MSVQHVRKWCNEIIEKVKRLLLEDRRVAICELALRVPEISASSIERILTEKLAYHKVCAQWVPRMLSHTPQAATHR
ncbi:hypothetical protein J437_LFUL007142, partial [Ladona fulva]